MESAEMVLEVMEVKVRKETVPPAERVVETILALPPKLMSLEAEIWAPAGMLRVPSKSAVPVKLAMEALLRKFVVPRKAAIGVLKKVVPGSMKTVLAGPKATDPALRRTSPALVEE